MNGIGILIFFSWIEIFVLYRLHILDERNGLLVSTTTLINCSGMLVCTE